MIPSSQPYSVLFHPQEGSSRDVRLPGVSPTPVPSSPHALATTLGRGPFDGVSWSALADTLSFVMEALTFVGAGMVEDVAARTAEASTDLVEAAGERVVVAGESLVGVGCSVLAGAGGACSSTARVSWHVVSSAVEILQRRVARSFVSVTSFPRPAPRSNAMGRLMDGEEYLQPFCGRCSARLIDALADEDVAEADSWQCTCAVPSSCPRCDPFFDGTLTGDLVDRTFFIPGELYLTWKAMSHMKMGHEKKNFHVGWTAALEASIRKLDMVHHTLRCEALMDFMPVITLLQATPATSTPRLVSDGHFLSCFKPLFHGPLFSPTAFHSVPGSATVRANFATPWVYKPYEEAAVFIGPLPEDTSSSRTSPEVCSAPVVATEMAIAERGGVVPARVMVVTNEEAEAIGISNPDLPVPPPSAGPQQLAPGSTNCVIDDAEVGFAIAPVMGNPVVYSPNDIRNVAAVMVHRVGGPHAEKREHKWAPTPDMIRDAKSCIHLLKRRLFTRENVTRWAIELGTLDQLFDPKLSEQAARNLITDLQAGYQIKSEAPFMVKRECTAKASKPPRGICDQGLATFVASAQVLKVIEHGLTQLDHAVNIKHRPRDEVLDSITAQCTEQAVFSGPGKLNEKDFPKESFRFLESDYTRFEFSQSLEFTTDAEGKVNGWKVGRMSEEEMGMLFMERELIRHVSELLPGVLHELASLEASITLPDSVRMRAVPKVKQDKTAFKKPCWALTLVLLFRLSGQGQTSWGNRLNNTNCMVVSTLKTPTAYWARLLDFFEGRRPQHELLQPVTWVFISRWGEQIRWRPWMEGDDFKAHIAGSRELAADPSCCDLEKLPNWKGVLERLHLFGLEPKICLYRHGRAEFVGGHMLAEHGFSVKGAWCPDVGRGLVTASVGTSEAMRGDSAISKMQIALSFKSRAMMFRGRVDPLYIQYDSYACHYFAAANGAENSPIKLDWKLAQQLGRAPGTTMPAREVWDTMEGQDAFCLELAIQKRLVEASVGGEISPAEWGHWMAAKPSVDDSASDVLASYPIAVRKAIPP